MNSINVSEIMDNRNIVVVPYRASLADLVSLVNSRDKEVSQVYVTDEKGCLQGIILLKELLVNISPYLFFCNENNKDHLYQAMDAVDIDPFMEKEYFSIIENLEFSSALESILSLGLTVVPVVNKNKQLLGELSCKKILKVLPSERGVFHHAVS